MVPLMPGISTFEGLVPVVVPLTTWEPTGYSFSILTLLGEQDRDL
jgi:hypothetical protein